MWFVLPHKYQWNVRARCAQYLYPTIVSISPWWRRITNFHHWNVQRAQIARQKRANYIIAWASSFGRLGMYQLKLSVENLLFFWFSQSHFMGFFFAYFYFSIATMCLRSYGSKNMHNLNATDAISLSNWHSDACARASAYKYKKIARTKTKMSMMKINCESTSRAHLCK